MERINVGIIRVRQAIPEDTNDILRLGKEFFYAGGIGRFMEFDEESTIEFINKSFVPENNFGVFVAEDDGIIGIAGVFVVPYSFNASELVGQELFWWVDPPFRGSRAGIKLYMAMMDYTRSRGGTVASMGALEELDYENLDKFYVHRGFTRTDHNYMMRL